MGDTWQQNFGSTQLKFGSKQLCLNPKLVGPRVHGTVKGRSMPVRENFACGTHMLPNLAHSCPSLPIFAHLCPFFPNLAHSFPNSYLFCPLIVYHLLGIYGQSTMYFGQLSPVFGFAIDDPISN